jgi:hypothetical protein
MTTCPACAPARSDPASASGFERSVAVSSSDDLAREFASGQLTRLHLGAVEARKKCRIACLHFGAAWQ